MVLSPSSVRTHKSSVPLGTKPTSKASRSLTTASTPVKRKISPSQLSSSKQPDFPAATRSRTAHTHAEIWKWTLSAHSSVTCFVKDVMDMVECDSNSKGSSSEPEYFWLGRVPCRTVKLLGMVVGVQVYEKRTVYTLDDGSGVIDCNYRHPAQQPSAPSPKKPSSRYKPPPRSSTKPRPEITPVPPPRPVAAVGDLVKVLGRVKKRYDERLIVVDTIGLCASLNEEPLHWIQVCELHETNYYPPSPDPFVIPQQLLQTQTQTQHPSSVSQAASGADGTLGPPIDPPQTPSRSTAYSASIQSTPSSTHSTSSTSTTSSYAHTGSPPRLRHPSRLHTKDLTANTFRIYLKHYMDNAPLAQVRPSSCASSDAESTDEDDFGGRRPETPTKRHFDLRPGKRNADTNVDNGLTPKPNKQFGRDDVNETPRATQVSGHRHLIVDDGVDKDEFGEGGDASEEKTKGFTLSYLRRVPELAFLAKRVVEAEMKRREREERRKRKEAAPLSSHKGKDNDKPPLAVNGNAKMKLKEEGKGPKMKRLFRHALYQLSQEGSIIMWDGPVYHHHDHSASHQQRQHQIPSLLSFVAHTQDSDRLWRMSSSNASSTSCSLSTTSSTISNSLGGTAEEDDYLSDPPPNEDSHIPLTSNYLLDTIISKIIGPSSSLSLSRTSRQSTYSSSSLHLPSRTRNKPERGATISEICQSLKRSDGRWEHLGEWAVKDAMEFGEREGRVWRVGGGRWEVCG